MSETEAPLESLLQAFIDAHEALIGVTREMRDAITAADAARVAECTNRQAEIAIRLAQLERQRRETVVAILGANPSLARPGAQPTLEGLCPALPEPARTRTRELAAKLRDVLTLARRESRTVRTATATMLAHMDGLMAQIGRKLSHDGTYGRSAGAKAGLAGAANVVSGIDLTS